MPQHCALSGSAMMLVQKGGCGAAMTMLHQCVSDDAAAGGVLQRSEDPFGASRKPKRALPARWRLRDGGTAMVTSVLRRSFVGSPPTRGGSHPRRHCYVRTMKRRHGVYGINRIYYIITIFGIVYNTGGCCLLYLWILFLLGNCRC
uniref:Uncharacterized protein n=1 Tax=Anopheles coluzzii TaxID=1518534 RepID=A0A8W7PG44_ANOCL